TGGPASTSRKLPAEQGGDVARRHLPPPSSLRPFRVTALTLMLAGLALTSIISPGLNRFGFVPPLVAGFLTRLSLSRLGMANNPGPFLPSSFLISSSRASKTAETSFASSPALSASSLYTVVFAIGLPASAFFFSAISPLANYGYC